MVTLLELEPDDELEPDALVDDGVVAVVVLVGVEAAVAVVVGVEAVVVVVVVARDASAGS